ncbi:unnamed protein product [Rhizophagus irregularis]|uniref:Uncharacterized protein n=3 Tax=Rhizophagus irregularis TaxID=588596 RepID=U9T2Y1_RHIID|nr:hypothetical protein GLOIN_2v1539612 [Rhizophagus irregularis DAOM 181602=DAOM 197198]EXX77809.1 hypothetical protein RirG_020400 [Rhizophagus irregularis DAOM 197198w]PKC64062.1 hypothetical protein RhiirA1_421980 [Rhizophagus irregularis]POG78156.1 hypothetical protein GLOIN_2v1539612 [Rhizophagus irregularis DAOM 181602=DAOM 197198]UZO19869.1 hypothetical protein OCT59_011138 [Rhizophagus irregularis]CAB4398559.1 unnamed protein product [Rhizophagus irregularis]|eukprot:XP_025185022.1 hypothetical protein GLOIN_2v1539612 [Rhizophagus irregularis DAOM 181602=DAOM 197198]
MFNSEGTTQRSDDEAPEVVSNSTSKIKALEIKEKERVVKQKLLEIKKRKRREIDAKLKEQKSRKIAKLSAVPNSNKKVDNIMKKIKEEGLPKFLPTELLEDFVNEDDKTKRRKQSEHTQIRLEMSKVKPRIKKRKKKQHNTGPFTVVALQDPDLDRPIPTPKEIMEFKDDHFYGERLPRKNAILNASQGIKGAAIRFCRK